MEIATSIVYVEDETFAGMQRAWDKASGRTCFTTELVKQLSVDAPGSGYMGRKVSLMYASDLGEYGSVITFRPESSRPNPKPVLNPAYKDWTLLELKELEESVYNIPFARSESALKFHNEIVKEIRDREAS
jgi:hypothetical protein